jgi:hypothetical protein
MHRLQLILCSSSPKGGIYKTNILDLHCTKGNGTPTTTISLTNVDSCTTKRTRRDELMIRYHDHHTEDKIQKQFRDVLH